MSIDKDLLDRLMAGRSPGDLFGRMRIPKEAGRGFRFDVGHHSDLKPATYSD